MLQQVMVVFLFTFIIHLSETLTYSLRLAGVRLGKLAVALSLSGIILLVSRTANMLQGPLTGKIIDYSRNHPEFNLVEHFRLVIGASTLGTLAAILLFPSAVFLSSRVIAHLEVAGSIPLMVRSSASIQKLKHARAHLRYPRLEMLSRLRIGGIPKRLVAMNVLVTAIYTIGVLAALLASTLTAENSTAASQASGLINGFATILLTILIDPQIGLVTDKVLRGEKEIKALNKMFGLLMLSRLTGTLLAQLLLVPAAYWIKWMVGIL
ncbi:lipid II flippase Amj family protein [Paenibacillus sepulcri]|uniref:Lipid II flippase Amj n=1 Tax=Paenibacillus sepulcri TaxID=359917 RepID=A0ABS7BYK6_9BACL|nr:lipid II flippase Amj family protein [Paenibacillus sepulcri]